MLLVYCFFASVLPVWVLLQPRDYINSHQLFVAMGCAGCHMLGTLGVGVTGPNLNDLIDVAGTRVAGEDAATYVHNSIVHPNDFVVEGFPAGVMPANLAARMSEAEIESLVTWLLDANRSYE